MSNTNTDSDLVLNEIGYAVRTAAAYGYAKGKHGASDKGGIDFLIDQAVERISSEVRKAQADALRETADWWAANPDDEAFETPGDTRNWMRDTATEYETED